MLWILLSAIQYMHTVSSLVPIVFLLILIAAVSCDDVPYRTVAVLAVVENEGTINNMILNVGGYRDLTSYHSIV